MSRVGTLRRTRRWKVLVVGAFVSTGIAVVTANSSGVAAVDCSTQVNDTPAKLVPCITTADLWNHMVNFQAIADANPGPDGHASRNSGEPGYKASVDYVAAAMQAAGYNVTIQTYTFPYFAFTAKPTFAQDSPTPRTFVLDTDFTAGPAGGTATGKTVQAAAGIIIPPTATPSSSSGCTPADFAGFVAGRVALVQRGTCTFGTKALNAQAAGASGIIIFNEGNPDRTDVFSGILTDAAGNTVVPNIPVMFTSFAVGSSLFTQTSSTTPPVVSIDVRGVSNPNALDYNVIAESK